MFKLVYSGFDTIDIAFQGALPPKAIKSLEIAREEACESQTKTLITLGPGEIDMHVSGHGMRGGFAFVCDNGSLGANWMFKKNLDTNQWNIFVSPRATMLLAYGALETISRIQQTLVDLGALIKDHSINRVDYAMDFSTENFELKLNQFVAHAHTKVLPHWSENFADNPATQPSAVICGRQLETVTIGKQPGRQIIVYDKRREAICKQKYFWFKAWNVDPKDISSQVWRVEIRAGKKELKDRWQIRKIQDFEDSIADVMLRALSETRYLADQQSDSNISRQTLHPLWIKAKKVVRTQLRGFRSGLTPGQIVEIERDVAQDRYAKLITSNAIGYAVTLGLEDDEIVETLGELVGSMVPKMIILDTHKTYKSIQRTRERLHFVKEVNRAPHN